MGTWRLRVRLEASGAQWLLLRWGHGCQVRGRRSVPGLSFHHPSSEALRQLEIAEWCIVPGGKDLVKGEGLHPECERDRQWRKEQREMKVTLGMFSGASVSVGLFGRLR